MRIPLANASVNRCRQCISKPPAFATTKAIFRYAFPINQTLQAYKYQHRLTLAKFYANACLDRMNASASIDCIIPVPLHPERMKTRGFNQSLEVARILSNTWQIPIDWQTCKRTRNTLPQANLKLKARVSNVKNAFTCTKPLKDQRILVVDDVMTTGASLNAMAHALIQAGAKEVHCLVIARTIPFNHSN